MDNTNSIIRVVPFGQQIGIDSNNMVAFSSDPLTMLITDQHSFIEIKIFNGFRKIFCGIKYQCVEYVRRWLIVRFGITFQQIDYAYMLYTHENIIFKNIYTKQTIPYTKCYNGSSEAPEKGTLIIWGRTNAYITGHVAIVLHTDERMIYIGEQNWDNMMWTNSYSRNIPITRSNDSIFLNDLNSCGLKIIGWLKVKK